MTDQDIQGLIANMRPKASRKPATKGKPIKPALSALKLPFDPLKRSQEVEEVVMDGSRRMYYRFRYANYYNGIATCDAVGCNLLCAYCWNYARNLNPNNAKGAMFLSPVEAASKAKAIMTRRKISKYRISGCEPFLGEASANHIIDFIRSAGRGAIIETNGLMLGYQPWIVEELEDLPCHIRVTLKGHDERSFEQVTGAKGEYYKYTLKAVETLKSHRVSCAVAIMPEFVQARKLGMRVNETESLSKYGGTAKRIKERGL